MWVSFLTMSTVGYGDYYPITYIGRLMAILSCIWGNFLQSLFVVSLISSAEFTKIEYRAYDKIKRYHLKKELKEA
jgi:voltage-gated potassium channel